MTDGAEVRRLTEEEARAIRRKRAEEAGNRLERIEQLVERIANGGWPEPVKPLNYELKQAAHVLGVSGDFLRSHKERFRGFQLNPANSKDKWRFPREFIDACAAGTASMDPKPQSVAKPRRRPQPKTAVNLIAYKQPEGKAA